MQPLDLCPDKREKAKGCDKKFCHYINGNGKCSLDFEPEDKEYEIGQIADALQISRQRVWRIYDLAIVKLQGKLCQE